MVRHLAAMPGPERKALKRRMLALFQRAEMKSITGKLDDNETQGGNKNHDGASCPPPLPREPLECQTFGTRTTLVGDEAGDTKPFR